MHIFRWLMTHPIATTWILAALAILLNLNSGTKNDHDKAGYDEKVSHEVVASDKSAVSNEAGNKETVRPKQAVSQEAGQVVKGQDSSAPATDVSKSINSATDHAVAVAATAVQASAETNTVEASVAKETTPAISQVKGEGLASMKTEQLIQLAREAFWHGDKDKSVAIYQALIEREPASLTHKGELANVYWHQEKQKESATLYAEIAEPMVKAGKIKEVANMLGFIGVFFPEKAAELQSLISQ